MSRRLVNVLALVLALFVVCHSARSATPAPCFPQILWANAISGTSPVAAVVDDVPVSLGSPYDTYAVWVCDTPTGYMTWMSMFTASNLAPFAWKYAVGKWTKAQADADCAVSCLAASATDDAFQQTLIAQYRPVATVAGSANQPIYFANADGTRNPTPIAGTFAIRGTPCVENIRIPGTPYFGIPASGLTRVVFATTPQWVYAICSVVFPIPPSPMPGQPLAPGGTVTALIDRLGQGMNALYKWRLF